MKTIFTFLFACFTTALYAQSAIAKYDIAPGFANSFPQYLTPFGSKICFYANDGIKGWELWKASATDSASMVADIGPVNAIAPATYAHPACELGGKLYFSANNGIAGQEVFVYDGSTTPTLAADVEPNNGSSYPDNFVADNGVLYFKASTAADGSELFAFYPANAMIRRLTDINTGSDSSVTGNVIAFNGNIYFTATTAATGNELYQYNVTLDNTTQVADINTGAGSSDPKNLIVINGKLYFSASEPNYGRELYVYDGTNTPARISDVAHSFLNGIPNYDLPLIAGMNGKIYFTATDQSDYHIYVYDPVTTNITFACKTNSTGSSEPKWLTNYSGKIFFSAQDSNGHFELYSYNDTNVVRISNLCASGIGSEPKQLTPIGSDLYFRATECAGIGDELFRYNPANVGVGDVAHNNFIFAYPNPVNNELIVETALQAATIQVSNIIGEVVYKNASAHSHEVINTNSWSAGTYLLQWTAKDGTKITKKIIKE